MASKTTAAIEAPATAIHSGFHNLNRAVAATNPSDCNEKLEKEEPPDEESPVVLAETLVQEVPLAEDVVRDTRGETTKDQLERKERLQNLQNEVQATVQRSRRKRNLCYCITIGLAFIVVFASVAAGVFCRQRGCIRSSGRHIDQRGAELERWVNTVSFSDEYINYPPKGDTAEELALRWLVEDDSELSHLQDQDRIIQRFALRTFYVENGPLQIPLVLLVNGTTQWFDGLDECQWGGVICNNTTGVIERLVVPYVGAQGALTANLALLSSLQCTLVGKEEMSIYRHLQRFDIVFFRYMHNALSSSLPEALFSLTDLTGISGFGMKQVNVNSSRHNLQFVEADNIVAVGQFSQRNFARSVCVNWLGAVKLVVQQFLVNNFQADFNAI